MALNTANIVVLPLLPKRISFLYDTGIGQNMAITAEKLGLGRRGLGKSGLIKSLLIGTKCFAGHKCCGKHNQHRSKYKPEIAQKHPAVISLIIFSGSDHFYHLHKYS